MITATATVAGVRVHRTGKDVLASPRICPISAPIAGHRKTARIGAAANSPYATGTAEVPAGMRIMIAGQGSPGATERVGARRGTSDGHGPLGQSLPQAVLRLRGPGLRGASRRPLPSSTTGGTTRESVGVSPIIDRDVLPAKVHAVDDPEDSGAGSIAPESLSTSGG